jgi:TRAP-type C4-dicarboxylate transport system substrate-binding protein
MTKRALASGILSIFLAATAGAAPITLKLASQAPENTPIGSGMAKLASELKRISKGEILLKVYHNGSQGDEEGMRQKMNTGLLDGALFDTFGLSHISPETMALSAPAVIADQGELEYVLEKTKPLIRSKIEAKGYEVIAFATIGWVRFFSRYPIATPQDLRKYKVAVNPYEKELMQLYKLAGLTIVLSPLTTTLQQLQSRAVDVFYTTPMYLSFQWSSFKDVGNQMTGLKVCPVVGGIVLTKRAWEKIPVAIQGEVAAACEAIGQGISNEFISKEDAIISDLKKFGLREVAVDAAGAKVWQEEFAIAVEKGTGTVYTREMMDLISQATREYRSKSK